MAGKAHSSRGVQIQDRRLHAGRTFNQPIRTSDDADVHVTAVARLPLTGES